MIKNSNFSSLILPFVFIILISFAIFMAVIYVEKQAKQTIHQSLFTVLEITQEALQRWAENHLQDLVDISNDTRVTELSKQLLSDDNPQTIAKANHELQMLMQTKMQHYSDQTFLIVDFNGTTRASKYESHIGQKSTIFDTRNESLKRLFKGEDVFISPIEYPVTSVTSENGAQLTTTPIVFVGAPIFDEKGFVVAALILGFNPMVHFTRITELGRIGRTGETYAFDKTGLLITKSRFTQNLKLLGLLGEKNMAMLAIRITDPGVNLVEGEETIIAKNERPFTLMAKRALDGNRAPYYESYRDYRGVPVFGAWLWNEKLGIGLTTEIDEEEALKTYRVTRLIFILVLGVIILLTTGLAFLPLWFKEKEREVLKRHKKSLEKTVRSRTEQLEQANHKLKVLSELDSLTKIANRRLYSRTLIREIAMASRTSEPLSLLMIDIDCFKLYNDNYGHDFGDTVLQEVAQVITKSLTRTTDFVARYGGEEFVAIMPATGADGALIMAEKVRANVEALAIEHLYSSVVPKVTVSIGVSTLRGSQLDKVALFKQADHALYIAKEKGRNQVSAFVV
ncbi:sensor domain-containing diguanylate cyclase [Marinomonas sp. S3726]|uniref:sensor domain-containing diguanylate cyclase n=1 Tax=Marinomonas sp. S3726 TaxID=579484 RepID=UPI000A8403AA|nr:sensor domain-containing diguanylate cyclase [Marinomonas sp. S3726]